MCIAICVCDYFSYPTIKVLIGQLYYATGNIIIASLTHIQLFSL